jgi:hypothetical protein
VFIDSSLRETQMMYFHPEILNEMVEKYIRSSQIILK